MLRRGRAGSRGALDPRDATCASRLDDDLNRTPNFMALFSKLPAKKPGASKADANGRANGKSSPNAGPAEDTTRWRPSKSAGFTITGFGLVEPSPTRRVIEVMHGNAGMCAVLENAVLLFASGHAQPARAL